MQEQFSNRVRFRKERSQLRTSAGRGGAFAEFGVRIEVRVGELEAGASNVSINQFSFNFRYNLGIV